MDKQMMLPIQRRIAASVGLLISVALFAGSAMAQSAANLTGKPPAPLVTLSPVTPAADSFYQELGGKPGVAAIVADFVKIMLEDKRLNAAFEGVDLDRLREKVAEQVCVVSGGPCIYTGKSMAESHEDLKTTNAQFNAAVEHLQQAMDQRGVPSRIQNRLLGVLAPTQHDIVTK